MARVRELPRCTMCLDRESRRLESNRSQNVRLDSACRVAGTGRVHFQQVRKEVNRPLPAIRE